MHFHVPKPLHGWRAFAGEVGIIVVGVLIALAAEQVVEALHWRSEIADAEQALNREAAFNLGAILKRQEEGPCIDRRLQEIRERLSAGNYGTIEEARQSIGQPQLWRPRTNVWQAAMAGQVAEHMPLVTRVTYAQLYDGFQWFSQKASDETDAWSVLGELDDSGKLLPADLAAVRQARSRAQVAAEKMDASLPGIVAAASRFGIKPQRVSPSPLTAASIRALCRPLR